MTTVRDMNTLLDLIVCRGTMVTKIIDHLFQLNHLNCIASSFFVFPIVLRFSGTKDKASEVFIVIKRYIFPITDTETVLAASHLILICGDNEVKRLLRIVLLRKLKKALDLYDVIDAHAGIESIEKDPDLLLVSILDKITDPSDKIPDIDDDIFTLT